jgi:hypothetical protein
MRIAAMHSHQNGLEFIRVHKPSLWAELTSVIAAVDATDCRVPKKKAGKESTFYSQAKLREVMSREFGARDWASQRTCYEVLETHADRKKAVVSGKHPRMPYPQRDFVKERIAVEVQFGKDPIGVFDLLAKHIGFFIGNVIDVGVEILAMKALQEEMTSGVGYYEAQVHNLAREGRGVPAVPLVLIGVTP